MRRRMSKPLLLAVSFATFCFLNTWIELAQGRALYFTRYDPRTAVALPVICWELIIASILLAGYAVLRRCRVPSRVRRLTFIAACLLPAGMASLALVRLSPLNLAPATHHPLFWPVVLPAMSIAAAGALRQANLISRMVRGVFLHAWPVLALIMLTAVWNGLSQPASAFVDGPPAPKLGGTPPIRVVWIVFDELSRAIAFDQRPAGLHLPNFDRLRAESFYATAANPPGNMTLECMPSLLLGRQVVSATARGPRELELKTKRGIERFGSAAGGNVFDDARRMGRDTALAGWYHPYCRVLNNSLTQCFWVANWLGSEIAEPADASFMSAIRLQALVHFTSIPMIRHVPGVFADRYVREGMAERTAQLLSRADRMVADPSLGLVLLHLPVPHPPARFNRLQGRIVIDGDNSYADSVAGADVILGRLLRQISNTGLGSRTAMIVTADHGWRAAEWRRTWDWNAEDERLAARSGLMGVPFIVRLPGQDSGSLYTKPFMTTAARTIVDGILSGRIRTAEDLARGIEQATAGSPADKART